MVNNAQKGKLYLGGGGGSDDSIELDKRFLSELTTKKVIYIPIALTPKENGYESCYDWITSTLTKASNEFIEITMWTDLSNKKIDDLEKYSGIYIGGGNTYKLLDQIQKTGFEKILSEFYNQGGSIYGGSAGAIILGKTISIVSEENNADYSFSNGLNLLNNKSVLCHFTPNKTDLVNNFLNQNISDLIVLTERSGLIIANDFSAESVGFDPVAIYTKSYGVENIVPGMASKI